MKRLKIYLSPYAYYVRLDIERFNQLQAKESFKKWIDNDKGHLPYVFIEFKNMDMDFDMDYPETVKNLGLIGSDLYCHHPFDFKTSSKDKSLEFFKSNFRL